MNKMNKIMLLLVISLLTIFSLSEVNLEASSDGFDHSQFVSELTDEEIEEEELQAKADDKEAYLELKEARGGYKDFSLYNYKIYNANSQVDEEKTLLDYEQKLYDNMAANTSYNDEQKDEYYQLVLGDSTQDGLTDYMYEVEKLLVQYSEDDSVIVSGGEAIKYIQSFEYPTPTISNTEYLNQMITIYSNLPEYLNVKTVSSLDQNELINAKNSNAILTANLNALNNMFNYYSLPKSTIVQRLMSNIVIMNIGLIVAIIILFVVRFPIVKKQQEYAWGAFKPLSLLVIPAIGVVFFAFFTYMFSLSMAVDAPAYKIYLNGESVSRNERIYRNEKNYYDIQLIAAGSDNTVSEANIYVYINEDGTINGENFTFNSNSYGELGALDFTIDDELSSFAYKMSEDEYEYFTLGQLFTSLNLEATDTFEPDELLTGRYIEYERNLFLLPYWIAPIWPALMFGTLFFMFILMPGPMVKMYLNELYTINKFCGFLSYNMAYRSNARVLIEETLQSLETCKFAEDFAIIFFEKNRNMTDKIQDISQIYSYKFFEMYLGIVNIIFDEGVSDATLKSLSIIQQFGDEYYNQADMFFKSKKGARGSLMMIIAICMIMPIMVRSNTAEMFLMYINSPTGYTFTVGCYLIWFGLICMIFNMYKNNKIVRQEGRYA